MNNIKNILLKVIGLLDQEQQTTFKQIQEENYKHFKTLNDRIAELEDQLAKRPVVYCARNRFGYYARRFPDPNIAVWVSQEIPKGNNDLQWEVEIYTGEQL